jgi:hypothetical protein
MTGPAEDPQSGPGYRRELAPPMSDGFYRAIGEYARAENATAEAGRPAVQECSCPANHHLGPDLAPPEPEAAP